MSNSADQGGVIHRGPRPMWKTPSLICRILHILQKPNSIIALLFIQNISSFLKGQCHAIWQLYKKLEGVFASIELQK